MSQTSVYIVSLRLGVWIQLPVQVHAECKYMQNTYTCTDTASHMCVGTHYLRAAVGDQAVDVWQVDENSCGFCRPRPLPRCCRGARAENSKTENPLDDICTNTHSSSIVKINAHPPAETHSHTQHRHTHTEKYEIWVLRSFLSSLLCIWVVLICVYFNHHLISLQAAVCHTQFLFTTLQGLQFKFHVLKIYSAWRRSYCKSRNSQNLRSHSVINVSFSP